MSIYTYNGQWLISGSYPAAEGDCCCGDDPPPLGACCWEDNGVWVCTQESEEACEDIRGGTWQGAGKSCDDIDCTEGCCDSLTTPDGCIVLFCRRGYEAGCVPCDPDLPLPPLEGTTDCEGGTPTQVAVSCSGFSADTGDTDQDEVINGLINYSYSVDLNCAGNADVTFGTGAYIARVAVGISSSRTASISVISTASSTTVASVQLSVSPETAINTECGYSVYPCSDFSGAASATGGTGGTLSVSGV